MFVTGLIPINLLHWNIWHWTVVLDNINHVYRSIYLLFCVMLYCLICLYGNMFSYLDKALHSSTRHRCRQEICMEESEQLHRTGSIWTGEGLGPAKTKNEGLAPKRGTTSVARMWVQEVCTYAADWSKRALMPLTTLNTERVDGVQPQRYSRVLERNPKLIHCKRLLPAAKHMAEHHGGGQR